MLEGPHRPGGGLLRQDPARAGMCLQKEHYRGLFPCPRTTLQSSRRNNRICRHSHGILRSEWRCLCALPHLHASRQWCDRSSLHAFAPRTAHLHQYQKLERATAALGLQGCAPSNWVQRAPLLRGKNSSPPRRGAAAGQLRRKTQNCPSTSGCRLGCCRAEPGPLGQAGSFAC